MKKLRILGKVAGIVFGTLGLSTVISSCKKERTCSCTTNSTTTSTYSYSYGGQSYTYTWSNTSTASVTKKIKKCSDLDNSSSQTNGNYSSSQTTKCVN